MRLRKICICERGPKEFLSPPVGFAYVVVVFQRLVLLPLNVCVTPAARRGSAAVTPDSAGLTSAQTFD